MFNLLHDVSKFWHFHIIARKMFIYDVTKIDLFPRFYKQIKILSFLGPHSAGALPFVSLSVRPSFLLSVRDFLSGAYLLSPCPNLAHNSPTKCLWVRSVQWPWTRSLQNFVKNPCSENIFSALRPIWLKLHSQCPYCHMVCSDFEQSL